MGPEKFEQQGIGSDLLIFYGTAGLSLCPAWTK